MLFANKFLGEADTISQNLSDTYKNAKVQLDKQIDKLQLLQNRK